METCTKAKLLTMFPMVLEATITDTILISIRFNLLPNWEQSSFVIGIIILGDGRMGGDRVRGFCSSRKIIKGMRVFGKMGRCYQEK